jgi:hypothetical protein
MLVFDDNWNTLCQGWSYGEKNVSCTLGSTLYDGNYHYYMYWYDNDSWSYYDYWNGGYYGYWYDYNEFVVINGTDRDYNAPWGEATFVDPYYGKLDVSGASSDKIVALLSARESSSGHQSGVHSVEADIYDTRLLYASLFFWLTHINKWYYRWNWIGGSNYHLDSGDAFKGIVSKNIFFIITISLLLVVYSLIVRRLENGCSCSEQFCNEWSRDALL